MNAYFLSGYHIQIIFLKSIIGPYRGYAATNGVARIFWKNS
jgi:hypothetical protein